VKPRSDLEGDIPAALRTRASPHNLGVSAAKMLTSRYELKALIVAPLREGQTAMARRARNAASGGKLLLRKDPQHDERAERR
jgi:hypothetical protein